ncbi:tetratricopeptide repeat protein [Allorhodopirellula solitaria]|nr:hypothetical protein [Allorhodopirellula solitaria]
MDGEKLVLMDIAGPADTAAAIREELLAGAKPSAGGDRSSGAAASDAFTVLLPDELESRATIQLVSNRDQAPSDLAIAAAARRSGVRYLLRGEIMHATGRSHSDQQLSVVWQLVGLDAAAGTHGLPITVDQTSLQRRYPELMAVPDPTLRLHRAMARETLGLIHESVVRQNVELANSYVTLGSAAVRRGNDLAALGNWPAAEDVWLQTLERYPLQTAAWINASIAAAARQDFDLAKQRITRAIRLSLLSPVQRHLAEETLVWLELRQRDYLESFDLPDPADGWRVTHASDSGPRSLR